jgi:hypothetical protein
MIKLFIARKLGTKGYTAGRMYWNGEKLCNTLEDEVRELAGKPVEAWKIKGATAIPKGRYKCVLSRSTRFKRVLPEILGVPGFTGIRIHRGNTAAHTEGCILVGMPDGNDEDSWLVNSAKAEILLIEKMKLAIAAGEEIWLTVA